MMIIISSSFARASHWATEGRLPKSSYTIITNKEGCQKLMGLELHLNDPIARVGHSPDDIDYIEKQIRLRIR